jgi:hypothetical protein
VIRFGFAAVVLLCASICGPAAAQSSTESFSYGAEWRFLRSGEIGLTFSPGQNRLTLKTVGLVSTLSKVEDLYTSTFAGGFCSTSLLLDSREGRKHRETKVDYDRAARRVVYLERDVKTGRTVAFKEMETPACVHEVTSALLRLRQLKPEPGATIELPVSDGKQLISARVDALAREKVKTPAGQFDAIKYEAFLFNGQLYRRKGRLFVWLTDDDKRLPVQIRIQLPFYIGTVTLQLEKMRFE